MGANYSEIQELLQKKADIQARLSLMPYDGNPEIKESNGSKYLYMRKRVAGKLTSTYVDVYSDELYQLLLRNAKERKDLNKAIRKINKDLAALGYEDKHAWEFILDRDVIQSESNYHMLCHIAKLVNEGFFYDGGRIRGIPVQIGGTSYVPPLPIETVVIERIDEIRSQDKEPIEIAI